MRFSCLSLMKKFKCFINFVLSLFKKMLDFFCKRNALFEIEEIFWNFINFLEIFPVFLNFLEISEIFLLF